MLCRDLLSDGKQVKTGNWIQLERLAAEFTSLQDDINGKEEEEEEGEEQVAQLLDIESRMIAIRQEMLSSISLRV